MRLTLAVTLALSLAANAFLLTRPKNNAAPDRRFPAAPSARLEQHPSPVEKSHIDVSSLSPEVLAGLREVDPATLRDFLEACGASGPMLRAAVAGAIRQQHMREHHEIIMANRLPGWWQPNPNTNHLVGLQRLDRKIADEEDRLVGHHPWPLPPWIEERHAFLPEHKKAALQRIDEDYDRMRIDLPHYPRLPVDEARAELLEAEYRKDVAALLNPEELAELDFRIHARASTAKELENYPLTDGEFRQAAAIIQARENALEAAGLQNSSIDPFAPPNPNDPAEKIKAAAREQIEKLVGPERLRVARRNQDSTFQEMLALATRLEIPRTRIEQAYDEMVTLIDDMNSSDSSPDARKAKTRRVKETLVGTLGPDAYDALRHSYFYWLESP